MQAFAPQANFLLFEPFIVKGFPGYYLLESKVIPSNQYQYPNITLPEKYSGKGLSTWQNTTVNWSNCDFVTSFGAANNNLPTPTQIDTYLQSLYLAAPWQMSSSGGNPTPIAYQTSSSVIVGDNVIYEISNGAGTSYASVNGPLAIVSGSTGSINTTGNLSITSGGTLTLGGTSLNATLPSATSSSIVYYNGGVLSQGAVPASNTILYDVPSTSVPGSNVIYRIENAAGTSHVSANGLFDVVTTGAGSISCTSFTLTSSSLNFIGLNNAVTANVLYYNSGLITQGAIQNQVPILSQVTSTGSAGFNALYQIESADGSTYVSTLANNINVQAPNGSISMSTNTQVNMNATNYIRFTAPFIYCTGTCNPTTLSVTNNSTLSGTLTVTGATTLNGTLTIPNIASLASPSYVLSFTSPGGGVTYSPIGSLSNIAIGFSTSTSNSLSISAPGTLILSPIDTVTYNNNTVLNLGTGTFTPPSSGYYKLSLSIQCQTTTAGTQGYIGVYDVAANADLIPVMPTFTLNVVGVPQQAGWSTTVNLVGAKTYQLRLHQITAGNISIAGNPFCWDMYKFN
jgi:hypothetical protein